MTVLRAGAAAALGVLAVHVVWVVGPERPVDPVYASSTSNTQHNVRNREALKAQISACSGGAPPLSRRRTAVLPPAAHGSRSRSRTGSGSLA